MDEYTPAQYTQQPRPRTWSSLWSIPMLCLGMCVIGACVLVPQAESNKKLTAERDKLKHDLAYVETQLSVNEEFLKSVGGDAGLAERLAQRQMKEIRQGTSVLELKRRVGKAEMSPFLLLSVAPPPAPAVYVPPGGIVGKLCGDARYQLYVTGLGMMMVAAGLVLGTSAKTG